MMGVLEITSTPDVVAVKMIMKCPDLRCAVAHVLDQTWMTSDKSCVLVYRKILQYIFKDSRI